MGGCFELDAREFCLALVNRGLAQAQRGGRVKFNGTADGCFRFGRVGGQVKGFTGHVVRWGHGHPPGGEAGRILHLDGEPVRARVSAKHPVTGRLEQRRGGGRENRTIGSFAGQGQALFRGPVELDKHHGVTWDHTGEPSGDGHGLSLGDSGVSGSQVGYSRKAERLNPLQGQAEASEGCAEAGRIQGEEPEAPQQGNKHADGAELEHLAREELEGPHIVERHR